MKYPDDGTGLSIQTHERSLKPSGKKPSEEMPTGRKIISTGKKFTENIPGPGVTTRSKKYEGLQRPSGKTVYSTGKKVLIFTLKKVVSTGKKLSEKIPDGVPSPRMTTRSKKRDAFWEENFSRRIFWEDST